MIFFSFSPSLSLLLTPLLSLFSLSLSPIIFFCSFSSNISLFSTNYKNLVQERTQNYYFYLHLYQASISLVAYLPIVYFSICSKCYLKTLRIRYAFRLLFTSYFLSFTRFSAINIQSSFDFTSLLFSFAPSVRQIHCLHSNDDEDNGGTLLLAAVRSNGRNLKHLKYDSPLHVCAIWRLFSTFAVGHVCKH